MSVTVYQIHYDRQDPEENNFRNHAAQAVKLFGSKRWNDAYWQLYTPAATVHTDDLEKSFEVMNLWNEPELFERHARSVYSMSVGDIIKRDGQFYMVDPIGFTPVTVEQWHPSGTA